MRWPQRVAAMLLTVVLLAGPPILLVRLVGWPTTDTPRVVLWQWVRDPLTEQNLTLMLVVLAWALWAFIAYLVTATTATRLWAGVRWLRHLPLPTPWQATATGIAGAAALTITTPTALSTVDEHAGTTVGTLDTHPSDGAEQPNAADGVSVPGGWLPSQVAEQVGAAASLMWLRRRRAYRPAHPGQTGPVADELAPLPATVTEVQAAIATHDKPALTRAAAGGILPEGFPPAGASILGPGAAAAARGLLVTALLARLRDHTAPEVVVTRDAVAALLGPAAPRLRPGPGLRIADDADHAAALLSAATAPIAAGGGGRPRSVLMLAAPPSGRLTDILTAGPVTAVVVASWPHAPVWHVNADGHTTTDAGDGRVAGPRMCVLDPLATTDLLIVTGHAHPAPHTTPTQPRIPRQTGPQPAPVDPGPRLQVRVLGEPDLLFDGAPLPVRRSAALHAVVYLAVHAGGVDSQQLAEALWPGLPAHRLTARLYTTLSDLRTLLRTTTGHTIIDRTGDRYRLNPSQVDVDLWRLRRAVTHAASTLTDHGAAWQAVVDAYTGDLATGYPWPWLDPHREAARRHVLDAYAALAAAEPDPRRALGWLQGGIRIDPYNATLHQRAIAVLTALGEHAAVAELSDRYARRIAAAGLDSALDAVSVPDPTT
ncbi:hypothetical protein KBX50_30330 [Micromonospora sp. C51]|uniref:hypothetical protein n=1 Tax=Micromonospora sp. C51 TaxID=2824879 RepID=UPI001B35B464|nr:hypothetical protein [Micromonospora sp. C51]MBQ1052740.1 hypothetical protein [Micromonospora sp. C51]